MATSKDNKTQTKIKKSWKKIDTKRKEAKVDLEEIRRTKDKKSKSQLIMGVIFTAAMTALIVTIIVSFGDIKAIGETLGRITQGNNWVYLIAALALFLLYFYLWPKSLISFSRALGIKDKNKDIFKIGAIEHFYNDVTPSAVGGQPFQVYAMRTIGVDTGKATGAVLMTYITFLLITNLYAFVGLVFFPYYLQGVADSQVQMFGMTINSTLFITITVIGYFLNSLTLIFMFLLGKSKTLRWWLIKIYLKICKTKLGKKFLRKRLKGFVDYCHNAQAAFKELSTHKKHFAKAFFARLIAMAAYYAIPFFLLLAVGVTFENAALSFFVILFATSFAITVVCWIPTPGTTGGVEIAFSVVLASLFHMKGILPDGFNFASLDTSAIALLWRMFTYYFRILLSFGINVVFEIQQGKKLRKEKKDLELAEQGNIEALSRLNGNTLEVKEIKESQSIEEPSKK